MYNVGIMCFTVMCTIIFIYSSNKPCQKLIKSYCVLINIKDASVNNKTIEKADVLLAIITRYIVVAYFVFICFCTMSSVSIGTSVLNRLDLYCR